MMQKTSFSLFSDMDIYLFKEGRHFHLYEKLGSHLVTHEEVSGVYFAVWAPNAESVFVIGDFNGWNRSSHPLFARWDSSGIFERFIPHLKQGTLYKYFIKSKVGGYSAEKGDPFAFHWETPPKTASIVWDLSYTWKDEKWQRERGQKNGARAPISIYEMHIGSWKRKEGAFLTYRELAMALPPYLKELGFTHVEFMPSMEHPFYGSWGYQKTGYFAPTSRFGTPQDFMFLIDSLHQEGIGVYLDWVPSHFPSDEHGLAFFDGTALYEHESKQKGFHPDWNSYIFNYGRLEVRNFLISSALFWLERYKLDGLRVDAVSSMLYLDYSRHEGEWTPNQYGGRENVEAIDFLRALNEYIRIRFPEVQMIAEESTAWPMVSRDTHQGGLGFTMKWDMGWMHDTLTYFSKNPIHRKYHHNELLFSIYYFYNENFLLPLSHDEVVHGKGSLLQKMPGDDWQKFANLRLLYTYMFTHPGKKLLFMGGEFAAWDEWYHEGELHWDQAGFAPHAGMKKLIQELNHLYTSKAALHIYDFHPEGFAWSILHDSDNSVIGYFRKGEKEGDVLLVLLNFTPVPREKYNVGLLYPGKWREIFNSDKAIYGGSDAWQNGIKESEPQKMLEHPHKITICLPPLAGLIFAPI